MDIKLTDSEIVKALEICQKPHDNDTCNNCKYKRNFGCRDALCNDILDLINRLQAENERLKAELEKSKVANSLFSMYVQTRDEVITEAKAEAYKEFAETYKEHVRGYTGYFEDNGFYISLTAVLDGIDFITGKLVGEDK